MARNSNLGPILHRFGDFAAFVCSRPHPYSTLMLGVFPLHQIAHVGASVSRELKLFWPWNYFRGISNCVKNILQRHGRTDGRTDDMWSHNRALRSIARQKVTKSHLKPASQPCFLWCKPADLSRISPAIIASHQLSKPADKGPHKSAWGLGFLDFEMYSASRGPPCDSAASCLALHRAQASFWKVYVN